METLFFAFMSQQMWRTGDTTEFLEISLEEILRELRCSEITRILAGQSFLRMTAYVPFNGNTFEILEISLCF